MIDISVIGYIAAAFFGLTFGSFAGATVWRLRARQLVAEKRNGEAVDATELKRLKPLTKDKLSEDRSRCLECQHTLSWYDLVPLVSWVFARGRCRYCHKKIGNFEPAMELVTAASFVAVYHTWLVTAAQPYLLPLWLVAVVLFVILFAYDLKWYILPDAVVFPLIALSVVLLGIKLLQTSDPVSLVASTGVSVIILSGIYFVLWLVSKGQWIGFGDVKLGLALGLLLADWQLAFLALFLANLIGTLIVIPGLLTKKMSRGTHVPFGPLLIAGFVLALVIGQQVLSIYEQLTLNMLFAAMLML